MMCTLMESRSVPNKILLMAFCIHLWFEARYNIFLSVKARYREVITEDIYNWTSADSLSRFFDTTAAGLYYNRFDYMGDLDADDVGFSDISAPPPERIALVMRAVDPIKPCLMQRALSISRTMQEDPPRYQNYDFYLLVDQTVGENLTDETILQEYFNENNGSNLEIPTIFGVSESSVREEFPELSSGYMSEPLVDGTYAASPTRPFMWQLMTPATAIFSRYHRQYNYTWVFEDDVWSLGKPLIELFQRWDEQMQPFVTDLAVFRNRRGGIPYNPKMQGKHTKGFHKILKKMKVAPEDRKSWDKELERDNQTRSSVWTEWNTSHIPYWKCVSDTFYRHSRAFSQYLYKALSKNVYQFAECYQQPLAWKGNFTISDLEILPIGEEGAKIIWEQGMVNKITRDEAIRRYKKKYGNVSILLYHGQSFYRLRNWTGSYVPPEMICRNDNFGLS